MAMTFEMLAPRLWWLHTGAANTYLYRVDTGTVVIDPGLPGNEDEVLRAVERLDPQGGGVAAILLTHWHSDHSGAAAALAATTGATVYAGDLDAAVLQGHAPGVPPDLTEQERPLHEAIVAQGAQMEPPHLPGTVGLGDGDEVPADPGATALVVGGHTAGSIAVHLPEVGAVLTGDLVGRGFDGEVGLGLFHVDRDGAHRGVDRLSSLAPGVAGTGHGDPIRTHAAAALARVAATPS